MTHIIYTNWQQRSSLANKPKTKQVCNIFFSATCQIVCGQIMSHHHIPLRLSQLSLSSRHHLFLSTLQFTSRISQKVQLRPSSKQGGSRNTTSFCEMENTMSLSSVITLNTLRCYMFLFFLFWIQQMILSMHTGLVMSEIGILLSVLIS